MSTLDLAKEPSLKDNKNDQLNSDLPAYDVTLIGVLENDHEDLLELFNNVLQAAKSDEYSKLQLTLVEFATSFTTHIKIEDEQLYGYLKILASKKSKLEQKVVAEFAEEMKSISTSIFNILSHSPFIPVDENNINDFIAEFENIGELLKDRITREEKVLYPIYKNSQ